MYTDIFKISILIFYLNKALLINLHIHRNSFHKLINPLLFYFIYILVILAVCVGTYVLQSAGLYTIAKRRGIRNPWLAWIPVGCAWIIGCISDQYRYVARGQVKNKRKALLILQIISWVLIVAFFAMFLNFSIQVFGMAFDNSMMPQYGYGEQAAKAAVSALGFLLLWLALAGLSIAMTVIQYMALYDVYHSCEPKNATLYLVLSIFISITLPIFLFVCRNRDEGMPPRKTEPEVIPQPVEEPWEVDLEEE